MIPLRIGYLPLSDAAPLIAAKHFGFAEAEGLALDLQRDVSWANLRDKLMVGHLDGAHLLAPMAIAATLGVGHVRFALSVPYVLSLNGNGITLSPELAEAMLALDGAALASCVASAQNLGKLVEKRQAQGRGPLTFAVVFPFSTHTYLLRRFLQSGGIDPDKDVQIVVVPPSYMVDSMGQGLIDGFCVGSPWNSVAVAQGRGVIVALGSEICVDAPEKVLAVPLVAGLARFGGFCCEP
jgi:two-component system, oxyanion-binding sensor